MALIISHRDVLGSIAQDLSNRDEDVRASGARKLAGYVAQQARELNGEVFTKFMQDLNISLLYELANSGQSHEKLGAIMAIEELLDLNLAEYHGLLTPLTNYLHICFSSPDVVVVVAASKALGHLARTSNTPAEFVEFEMKRALEWLQGGDRYLYSAVLMLKELALNIHTRTAFLGLMDGFIDLVWIGLRDPRNTVRETTAEALHASLLLADPRAHIERAIPWCSKLFDEAQRSLQRNSLEAIHGSLLVIGELLTTSPVEFMNVHYKEVWDIINRFKGSREKIIRNVVSELLPLAAKFNPDLFVRSGYLHNSILHLLAPPNRSIPSTIDALGQITTAVKEKMKPYMPELVKLLQSLLVKKKQGPEVQIAAVRCVGTLAAAYPQGLQPYISDLLKLLFSLGLSSALTVTLREVLEALPDCKQQLKQQTLNLLAIVLSNKPLLHQDVAGSNSFASSASSSTSPSSLSTGGQIQSSKGLPPRKISSQKSLAEGTGVGIAATALSVVRSGSLPQLNPQRGSDVILAFQTLREFKLGNRNMLVSFVSEVLIEYLEDNNPTIRKEAMLTCSKLVSPACIKEYGKGNGQSDSAAVVDKVLRKLLTLAATDREAGIRSAVLASLGSEFDFHLAQEESLRLLFMALNDESFRVRELALRLLGRIAHINAALVMPTLRLVLNQVLAELDHCTDSGAKEEYEQMLIHLIRIRYEKLIQPNVKAILKAIIPKIQETPTPIAILALDSIGELAQSIGDKLLPYIPEILPKLMETLMDQGSTPKREAALRTLANVAENCGYVITPYLEYPKLLDLILNEIKNERTPAMRKEAVKLLGILGAIDPDKHKLSNSLRINEGELNTGKKLETDDEDNSVPLASDEYYPTVAIAALMRILKNQSLTTHHNRVIEAVVLIFRSIGTRCLPFLPRVIGPFLSTMRSAEPEFSGFLFQQLSILVSIVKQHIRPYLADILVVVKDQWNPPILPQIVTVLEEVALAGLRIEIKDSMSDLVSRMAAVLSTEDNTPKYQATKKILQAWSAFSETLSEYLYLVIPAIVLLLERVSKVNSSTSTSIQIEALRSLSTLSNRFNTSMYATRIIHPLVRLLETSPPVRKEVMETICVLGTQLGSAFLVFVPMVTNTMFDFKIQHSSFDNLLAKLQNSPARVLDMSARLESEDNQVSVQTHLEATAMPKLKVNEFNFQKVWAASRQFTRDDWVEWIRKFAIGQLCESPSPALRACLSLASMYPPLLQELFKATFASCYNELSQDSQRNFVKNLKNAMLSEDIPAEILQALLNVAEFMELCEKPLPIGIRTLATLAEKCHAFAKTLRYLESEFANSSSSSSIIEALISANDMLQQREAAIGIIVLAQKGQKVELKESWYEKLQRWEDALSVYERKPRDRDVTMGMMRCLHALGEWERLEQLTNEVWTTLDSQSKDVLAPIASNAAFNLGRWDSMSKYLNAINRRSVEGSFYAAIYSVHHELFERAEKYIIRARELIGEELGALVGESYSRAYNLTVLVQQLAELQEVIDYKQAVNNPDRRATIKNIWEQRLHGCQPNPDIWQRLLAIRSLVVPPKENLSCWLKFVRLCRKYGRMRMANTSILILLDLEEPGKAVGQSLRLSSSGLGGSGGSALQHSPIPFTTLKHCQPQVVYAYLKQLWALNQRKAAFQCLQQLANLRSGDAALDSTLRARCYHTVGKWQLALNGDSTVLQKESDRNAILNSFKAATEYNKRWWKAWHSWALVNTDVISQFEKKTTKDSKDHDPLLTAHLVCAIDGYFRSIALGPNTQQGLQDILRLLTLWFKYGSISKVDSALHDGFETVSIDTWLNVIPQLIARIHISNEPIRKSLHKLLAQVGKEHPQALIYPLTVASKSQSTSRIAAAQYLMEKMKQHSPSLVQQALLVSQELIRVAILWREMWKDALDEALRCYMDQNTTAMFSVLTPVFQTLQKGPETPSEESFKQLFAADLERGWEFCQKFNKSGKISQLNKGWDIFFQVLRRVKLLPQFTTLELQHVSPKLLEARDLDLAMPGTYQVGDPVVRIRSFIVQLTVFHTKQKPRKLWIKGSDGYEYVFLLKGHEDLRQDERVMQLFGLVNTLLAKRHETSRSNLSIQRYTVIPLSPNSGLAGWVDSCDTLHTLIMGYRTARKLDCLFEHKKILENSPDASELSYESMMLIQRVEAFEHGTAQSPGNDLQRILWLKSTNSESWLYRRTNYTRSLAVMSMVGYILGLGDRHPNNLMLHRHTGKIIHIDFGDCFEVAMHRERYSERIPFRLTRMIIKAMGVSGVEGLFRITSENVMNVLRDNKESLMAMLEAFVHDPLINWRLLDLTSSSEPGGTKPSGTATKTTIPAPNIVAQHEKEKEKEKDNNEFPIVSPQILNQRAISVIDRVERKLTGRDFNGPQMDVPDQVRRLIEEAASSEHLCLCYSGWCPFW